MNAKCTNCGAIEVGLPELPDKGLSPTCPECGTPRAARPIPYRCRCSYPCGPHTLACLIGNPNATPPGRSAGPDVLS